MFVIDWVASLTPAQRDAIRTVALVIGSAAVPVFGFILTWGRRGIKRLLRELMVATHVKDFEKGVLRTIPVSELVRKGVFYSEETLRNTRETKDTAERVSQDTQQLRGEFRSEISDLVNDPRAGVVNMRTGRRRNPDAVTDEVPSLYTVKDPDKDE
jgi:hypothetical protein